MGRNPTKTRKYKGYFLVPCAHPNRTEKWYLAYTSDGKEEKAVKFCNLSSGENFIDHMIASWSKINFAGKKK